MVQALAIKDKDFTSVEIAMLAKAKEILDRFFHEASMPGFERHEAFAYIGKLKNALGMPESRLAFEDIGVAGEEALIRHVSMR